MGKKAKEHRKKVQKRNQKISEARNQFQKAQKNFLEKMLEDQKLRGENTPHSTSVEETNPFDIQGPQI